MDKVLLVCFARYHNRGLKKVTEMENIKIGGPVVKWSRLSNL